MKDPGPPRKKFNRLSLCMIVKNEEAMIEGCLKSVEGIVDEIVIADTGSLDKTVERALRFNPKLMRIKWTGDFSAARNEALRHCTGDWVLCLDADERLVPEQKELLRSLMEKEEVTAYSVQIRHSGHTVRKNGGDTQQMTAIRLFRRAPGVRYEGKVHEQLLQSLQRTKGVIEKSDLAIEHLGYRQLAASLRERGRRYLTLLFEELQSNPQNPEAYYQIGNTFMLFDDSDAARKYLMKALSIATLEPMMRAKTANLLAALDLRNERFIEAVGYCKQSLHNVSNQATARWLMAVAYYRMENYHDAIAPLQELLSLMEKKDPPPLGDLAIEKEYLLHMLGKCHLRLEEYQEAADTLLRALLQKPHYREIFEDFLIAHESLAKPEVSLRQFEELVYRAPDDGQLLLAVAHLYWRMQLHREAFDVLSRIKYLTPDNSAVYLLEVRWQMEEGNYGAAEKALKEARRRMLYSYELYERGLELTLKQHDVQIALKHLQQIDTKVPPERDDLKERLHVLVEKLSQATA